MVSSRGCSDATSFWIGDIFISCFLLYPSMVFYWRGIWDLVGVYTFPDNELKRVWTLVGLGCGTILGYIFHPLVAKGLRNKNKVTSFILTRIYMAIFAVFPMAYWRGVWTCADYYLLQYGWKGGIINYFICEVVMHVLRIRQTAIFPPLYVAMDTRKDVLTPGNRFGTKPGVTWKYTFDSLFTNYIALTFSILLWRGAWTCLDAMLYTSLDLFNSNVLCLGVGYGSVLIIMFLDPVLMKTAKRIADRHKDSSPRTRFMALLLWEDFVFLVAFWAHLFIWRGCWNLNAEFIIVDFEIGGWVNNLIGTVLFLVFQVYSFVACCGCVVDGWMDGTQDRVFNTQYLETVVTYFKGRKVSKIDSGESQDDLQESEGKKTSSSIYAISYDHHSEGGTTNKSVDDPDKHKGYYTNNITSGFENKAFEIDDFTHL